MLARVAHSFEPYILQWSAQHSASICPALRMRKPWGSCRPYAVSFPSSADAAYYSVRPPYLLVVVSHSQTSVEVVRVACWVSTRRAQSQSWSGKQLRDPNFFGASPAAKVAATGIGLSIRARASHVRVVGQAVSHGAEGGHSLDSARHRQTPPIQGSRLLVDRVRWRDS